MRRLSSLALALVFFLAVSTAQAQEKGVVPGDFCPVGDLHKVYQDGGVQTGGDVHLMVCDGAQWQPLSTWRYFDKGPHLGLGTTNPHEMLELNGNLLFTGANSMLADAGGYLGIKFKNVTMLAIANIVQVIAPIRIDSFLSFNPGAYVLFPNGIWDAKGRVGLGTQTPKALLDVNGLVKLKLNDREPAPCKPDLQGSLALTREARMCACNASNIWVDLNSENACIW